MTATRLHTVPETAAHLGVNRSTVYDLIARGDLRAVDIGHGRSKTRIRDDDLAAFIDARTAAPARRQRLQVAHSP